MTLSDFECLSQHHAHRALSLRVLAARDIPFRTQSTQDDEHCSEGRQARCVSKDECSVAQ